ncbi:MAG TPA: 30S ribosomal protein S1, partial [Candidatus Faeciplasma avium]|nr:30S ribosomal protein S1 [Candidatus Faeciplasma avium]
MIYPPEGIIINSASNRAYLKSPDDLERAYRDGAVLESIAEVCTQSHDLITALPKMRGIMPREEVSIG